MTKNILEEIYQDLQRENPPRLEFTRRAFELLQQLDAPRILDIGCGQGEPTLELARLSKGEIIGMDTNQGDLDELTRKIEKSGLSDRVHVVNGSMLDIKLPDESFDVIWSEGSIQFIGFEKGLEEWRRLLKPSGFLVIHEMTWLRPDPPGEIVDRWQRRLSWYKDGG